MSIQEIQTMEDQGTGGGPGQTETSAADAAAVPVLPLRFERQGIYWRLDRLSCGRFLAHVLRYLSVYGDKSPDWNGNLLYAEIAEDDLLLLGALFENMQLEERVLQLLPARPCEPLTLEGRRGVTLHVCYKTAGQHYLRSLILEATRQTPTYP